MRLNMLHNTAAFQQLIHQHTVHQHTVHQRTALLFTATQQLHHQRTAAHLHTDQHSAVFMDRVHLV